MIWQLIGTAPRDGTKVLLYLLRIGLVVGCYKEPWDNHIGWYTYPDNRLIPDRFRPTHWMPLPGAPETESK